MAKIKYVGDDNGLFTCGMHFSKGVVVEVPQHVCDTVGGYNEFEVVEGTVGKAPKKKVVEEEEELEGDVDGDGDVDMMDVIKTVKNLGKKRGNNKRVKKKPTKKRK